VAGELPIDASLPQIWVDDAADADRAKAIIDEFVRSRATGPAVKCPECGEENPPSFDLCWKCGRDLTAAR
jgi:uncharacterized OB-fold protein